MKLEPDLGAAGRDPLLNPAPSPEPRVPLRQALESSVSVTALYSPPAGAVAYALPETPTPPGAVVASGTLSLVFRDESLLRRATGGGYRAPPPPVLVDGGLVQHVSVATAARAFARLGLPFPLAAAASPSPGERAERAAAARQVFAPPGAVVHVRQGGPVTVWLECECPVQVVDWDVTPSRHEPFPNPGDMVACPHCGDDHRARDVGQLAVESAGSIDWFQDGWRVEPAPDDGASEWRPFRVVLPGEGA